ncbi:hypothetical protein [Candidatus Albibeggiatoa sp. nov. NOAA]|uniref:hypothetical protein n=1 Tax=Candidatus Albibeggiatoa sp. nov. NOAA TaxID=3162724 RepID=UPI00330380F3|nr:hypothetical protein [Thiotrichaceae bacterium]
MSEFELFGLNLFFIYPWRFLAFLLVFIIIFHFLFVWPNNLSKKNWKRVDYIWLGAASLGILSLASDVRIYFTHNWLEIEKSRAVSLIKSVEYRFSKPENSHYCAKFVRYDLSPDDFEERVRQYNIACKWRKDVEAFFKNINKHEIPSINHEELPVVEFNLPALMYSVTWLNRLMIDYASQLEVIHKTESYTVKYFWEEILSYFAPFLICIALSLRIAKVSGEIRHET